MARIVRNPVHALLLLPLALTLLACQQTGQASAMVGVAPGANASARAPVTPTAGAAIAVAPVSGQDDATAGDSKKPVSLYPMRKGRAWGFIDAAGAWAIEPIYSSARRFVGGLAPAQAKAGGPWGYVDARGEWVIQPRFQHPQAEAYARMEGHQPEPAGAAPFANGLATVWLDGERAVINKRGEVQFIGKALTELGAFAANGLARAQTKDEYGFVNRHGEFVVPSKFEEAGAFGDDLAPVSMDSFGSFGYINKRGEWVIQGQFGEAGRFVGGLAPVELGAFKWNYINKQGERVFDHTFEAARPFSEGLAAVELESGWAFITPQGTVVFKQTQDGRALCHARDFHGPLARVFVAPKGNHCGAISRRNGHVWVDNGLMAWVDRQGRVVHQESVAALHDRQAKAAARKADESAEDRRERAHAARAGKQRRASCADLMVWGNPAMANMIEVSYQGEVRRFFFPHAAVEVFDDGDSFKVTLPAIEALASGATINFGKFMIEQDFADRSNWAGSLRGYRMTGSGFCLEFPTELAGEEGEVKVLQWQPPANGEEGSWQATVKVTGDDTSTYLKARFDTAAIFMPSSNEPVADPGFYSDDDQRKRIDSVQLTWIPAENTLKSKIHLEDGSFVYDNVHHFPGKAGRYAVPVGKSWDELPPEFYWLYDITAFGHDGVHFRKYRVPTPKSVTSGEDAQLPPGTLSPADGKLVADVTTHSLSRAPDVEKVLYAKDGQIVPGKN